MKNSNYYFVEGEVQRRRPLASVVLAVLVTLPSLWQTVSGNLSVVTFLFRLTLALALSMALVWLATGVFLHYARVQERSASTDQRGQREK